MLETFRERSFKPDSLAIIEKANEIIAEYDRQGFTLTLRQLYYQFVARALIPNKQSEYKRLGSIINDARLAGMVSWLAIEDRTRNVRTVSSWDGPEDIIRSAARSFKLDWWEGQTYHVEVWIEKDALIGVVEPVCDRWRVPYFACRGYTSQSEQWRAGRRFRDAEQAGKQPIVLHLGDHDPSGLDMTRDNQDRLTMFARRSGIEVRRLALNWNQVEQYDPPPNPAKETDSRSGPYIEQYGESSWELDALDPAVIDQIIDREISTLVDDEILEERKQEEETQRALLEQAVDRWDDITAMLEG